MSRNSWETPQQLFDTLNEEYRFGIDAAANAKNKKCDWWWDEDADALKQDWEPWRVWCNPPYRKRGQPIEDWVNHAVLSKPVVAVFLLPASVSSLWFYTALTFGEIHFFRGRVNFVPPPGITASSNDRDSVLVVLGQEAKPGVVKFRNAKTGEYVHALCNSVVISDGLSSRGTGP